MAKIQDLRSITPRSNGTRSESQIKNIARHHSATATGDWFAFWPHWNKTRGWGTGGYHEIILRDGTVQLCYDPNEITNGVANHNHAVYNICIVGNGSFTAAQEKSWKERCLIALKRFNLPVSAVKGHNEFSGTSTSCPGINMNTVRKTLSNGSVPTPSTPAKPVPSESIVDYLNAKGEDASFTARAKLAVEYGISNYSGTAAQNTQLLKLIKAGKPSTVKPAEKAPAPKPVTPVSKPKEEDDMLKQAIVIGSLNDYASAEILSIRRGIPIFPRNAVKGEVAKELIIVGGNPKGLKADKITNLSGSTRFETAKNVEKYL